MIFQSPGPVLLELGPLAIRWYGLLYATALIVCLAVADKYLRPQTITKDELSNFAVLALVSGIVGARVWYVLLNYEYFLVNPLEIPQIWLGGQSIQGGMLGVWLGTWLFDRKDYLTKLAIIITVMPLAQAIGRWGNFFNEEAYGSVTELPWKLYISYTGTYHHPTFLYESIWNLLVFVVLFILYKKLNAQNLVSKHSAFMLIGSYLFLYSLGRFFLEMLRTDSLMILGYPAASIMSVIGIVVGLILLGWRFKIKLKRHPEESAIGR